MQGSERLRRLRQILRDIEEVAIAYSGGMDSTLLLKIAREELGGGASAIICSTDLMAEGEALEASRIASDLGVKAVIVNASLLGRPEVAENTPDRCYQCKKIIFQEILEAAAAIGLETVADGTHSGDEGSDRPGMRALRELGVRSPLSEAGMDKDDIREASRALGLPTMARPASACLATRIPFGVRLTPEMLRQVDAAERLLKDLGYAQVRVRHHGALARVEVEERLLAQALGDREIITTGLKSMGFTYVTLDLEGFRSGSMSEILSGRRSQPEAMPRTP